MKAVIYLVTYYAANASVNRYKYINNYFFVCLSFWSIPITKYPLFWFISNMVTQLT